MASSTPAALRYSVVLPVFNEHEVIGEYCAKARAELPGGYELLICYDMDEDSTLPAVAAIDPAKKPENIRLIRNTLGRGVRYAIEAGMRAASAPVVVVMMADVSDDFSKVEEMVAGCENGAAVVCASRYMKGGKQIGGPWFKGLLSRCAGVTLHWWAGLPTHDATNSFKAYHREFLGNTPIESEAGFSLGMELTLKAHFGGHRVEEVPATWRDRTGGESRFRLFKWLPLYLRWYFWAFRKRWINAWSAVLALLLLFTFSVFVPWQPTFSKSELDASWCMVLHWARIHRVDFGHELVFTYGPWGFVSQGFDPQTFNSVAWCWLFLAAAFFAAVMQLSTRLTPRKWLAAMWILLVIAVAGSSTAASDEARIFALCWALLLVHFYVDDRPTTATKVFLAIALGLAALIKFSLALVALLALLAVSGEQLRRRKVPWLLFISLISMIAFWLAAGQRLASFGPYLSHSLHITSGYAQAMSVRSATEARDVTLFVLCALFFLSVLAVAHRREIRAPWKALLATGALAAGLLLMFKLGFVRHDRHEATATKCLALLSLLYLAALWKPLENGINRTIALVLVAGCLSLHWYSERKSENPSLQAQLLETVTALPARVAIAGKWMRGQPIVKERYEAYLDEVRNRRPVPIAHGTVDAYPTAQAMILGHGLPYRPRPAFQSYMAYTGELARMNADFLRSARAPDSILFDIWPIDGRLSALEDGASWPELLTRYDLKDASKSLLLLERAAEPRSFAMTPLLETQASLGEWLKVPQASEPVWLKLDIKIKPLGKLVQTLYKLPAVHIEVKLAGGSIARCRLVPDLAREGFLISPAVPDRLNFALLNSTQWAELMRDVMVSEIRITAGDPASDSSLYDRQFQASFYQLQFPHRDISHVPGIGQYVRFNELIAQGKVVQTGAQLPQVVNLNDGSRMLMSPPGTRLLLPSRPGAKSVRVTFGALSATSKDPATVPGAEFRAYAIYKPADGGLVADLIWSRKLEPSVSKGDRDFQTAEFRLPEPAPIGMMLETASSQPQSYPCWADVEFR